MKQHEREYFISRIRSGKYVYKNNGLKLEILTPTIEDELEADELYIDTYESCIVDGCMTLEQNLEWMVENGLWSEEEDKKIETINSDIEKLKIKIFEERNNSSIQQSARLFLRAAEKALNKLTEKKNQYFSKTCEGIATSEKACELVRRCTYNNGLLFSFNSISLDYIVNFFYSQIIGESRIRELARNDPWKTLWSIYDNEVLKLFNNKDRELSSDQKNLIVWSQMYDNIHESLECPDEEVINDDDMLDGWFIVQRKKREQQKKESNMENQLNQRVANSQEVFLMAGSVDDAKKIDSINNNTAQMIKKQRFNQIKKAGSVDQINLQDEQLKLRTQATQGFKSKFRR